MFALSSAPSTTRSSSKLGSLLKSEVRKKLSPKIGALVKNGETAEAEKLKAEVAQSATVADAADAAAATSVGGMGRALGLDLNKATMAPPGVFALLEALGLDRRQPTLVVSEAVLFYLSPPAKRALLQDVGTVLTANAASALVLTDNLAPFVRGPMRQAADAFLSPLGLTVREHDTLWGGAIQFIRADGVASASP